MVSLHIINLLKNPSTPCVHTYIMNHIWGRARTEDRGGSTDTSVLINEKILRWIHNRFQKLSERLTVFYLLFVHRSICFSTISTLCSPGFPQCSLELFLWNTFDSVCLQIVSFLSPFSFTTILSCRVKLFLWFVFFFFLPRRNKIFSPNVNLYKIAK